jgi:Fe-S oxidoreductase
LGGNYEVLHHTQFLQKLISDGRLKVRQDTFKGKRITFHDPCYLGRANEVYAAPRSLLNNLGVNLVEMKRSKQNALCCGAGGAQMFKEPEKGDIDVNVLRTEDALQTNPEVIATGCPYCNTMITDGVKFKEKEGEIKVLDVAELLSQSLD